MLNVFADDFTWVYRDVEPLVIHPVEVAVLKDGVVAAAGSFPRLIVFDHDLPRLRLMHPLFGAAT